MRGALHIEDLPQSNKDIYISNKATTRYAFGLNQSLYPLRRTPLFIAQILQSEIKIIKTTLPLIERVLLLFSSQIPQLKTSTIVDTAFAPGILISLSQTEPRDVTWDKDHQWGPQNQAWIRNVNVGDDLTRIDGQ